MEGLNQASLTTWAPCSWWTALVNMLGSFEEFERHLLRGHIQLLCSWVLRPAGFVLTAVKFKAVYRLLQQFTSGWLIPC